MRYKLDGGYSLVENTGGFQAYSGFTQLGTGFYKTRAKAVEQIALDRKKTGFWNMTDKDVQMLIIKLKAYQI